MKKVELLAPAGNYECFLGAVHAGADAVYLGGNKFGARAYADNFSEEEIIKAIEYAHVRGKKVYLTINTLVKEDEFSEIYGYMQPLYRAGLDGAIIQDMGVFRALGRWFPGLERHISTQMTVTGVYGATYLKNLGAVRIVPARELSIAEIKNIKSEVDIEIETFVHGAICYCYSGQCLFSSIVGGRSGNRGRCAQPCRLPYEVGTEKGEDAIMLKRTGKEDRKKEQYPLSLKDMCTIEMIPELIEAGIDSFKIEGRMKSPEYVAGVTALYRKYIDKYYEDRTAAYSVEKRDMDALRSLYIRSEISEGYYHKHNGRDMITLDNPSYGGRDDALLLKIRDEYLQGDYRLPAKAEAKLYKNNPAYLSVTCNDITVSMEGNTVEEALKQPLNEENVKKQLSKSGNTAFIFESMKISMDAGIFIPVKALNDLRRTACEALEEKIIESNNLAYSERKKEVGQGIENGIFEQEETPETIIKTHNLKGTDGLHVLVQSMEQLRAALKRHIQRIYVSSDLFEMSDTIDTIVTLLSNKEKEVKIYLSMPYIIRDYDKIFLGRMERLLGCGLFEGVLIRNQEELQWLKEISYSKDIVMDINIYFWNKESYDAYKNDCRERYIPLELNFKEIASLVKAVKSGTLSQVVYGRIPMMITANCISKTMGYCRKKSGNGKNVGEISFLKDRYRKLFPVYLNCRHCYNIIYNSVPMSLHHSILKIQKLGISSFRLDFTTETGNDADKIILFYEKIISQEAKGDEKPPFAEYTNAHLNRGVE
ncbi:MAG: U32 family peptidase [Clostridiales bacterium]|nr:U32 family peptidase [Clostridiales bacterium]